MTLNDQTNVVNYYSIIVLKFRRSFIINVKVGLSVTPVKSTSLKYQQRKLGKTAYKLYLCVECYES